MKVLFIGGTGTISTAIVKRLIKADINDEAAIAEKIKDHKFDVVSDFIAFTVDAVERDYRLFKGKTSQYMFISSASAYHKPAASYIITEGTTLSNPHWEYSRNKIKVSL